MMIKPFCEERNYYWNYYPNKRLDIFHLYGMEWNGWNGRYYCKVPVPSISLLIFHLVKIKLLFHFFSISKRGKRRSQGPGNEVETKEGTMILKRYVSLVESQSWLCFKSFILWSILSVICTSKANRWRNECRFLGFKTLGIQTVVGVRYLWGCRP